jgi:hypothetical protein
MQDPLESEQISVCRQQGANYVPASLESKLGFSFETEAEVPTNGLRHSPQGDTNGWYIWGGKTFSTAPEFFSPLHTRHMLNRKPEIVRFLGLPPGYRFLVDGDYVDVWFDSSLLDSK